MKIILLTFFIFSLFLTASAQKKVTDREFERLNGAVKSVVEEYMEVVNSRGLTPDKKRVKLSEYSFDKESRLVQILYPSTNSKLVFSVIDGFKTFKSSPLGKEIRNRNVLRVTSAFEPKPIEEPEKLVPPDERFDQKYIYKYDSQGRVEQEREYLNNGRLVKLTTYKYDDKGRLIEEKINDTVALSKFIYKYDEKGNLIEKQEDRDIKGPGYDSKSKTVYSDYKLDAEGNWIQRKSTWYFDVQGEPKVSSMIYYRTIIYY